MVKDVLQQRHVVVGAFWSPFEVLMHHELPSQPFWLLTLFPVPFWLLTLFPVPKGMMILFGILCAFGINNLNKLKQWRM